MDKETRAFFEEMLSYIFYLFSHEKWLPASLNIRPLSVEELHRVNIHSQLSAFYVLCYSFRPVPREPQKFRQASLKTFK